MAYHLAEEAFESSTYVISVSFYDENDEVVTPKTFQWSLTETDGTIVNSRSDVVETPASTVNIVLSGDDLAITDNSPTIRLVALEATYDSDFGTDLPLNEDYQFLINNIRAI